MMGCNSLCVRVTIPYCTVMGLSMYNSSYSRVAAFSFSRCRSCQSQTLANVYLYAFDSRYLPVLCRQKGQKMEFKNK